MKNVFLILTIVALTACSKKHTPSTSDTVTVTTVNSPARTDSAAAVKKKPVRKPTQKDIIPNSITVNDKAAKKAVDGRLYYDLLGHRYWKNYRDGKYYLFSQKMYDDPAFKPPK